MIRNHSFEVVIMDHFEKNWRRMDMQNIMKGMLRFISSDIGGDTYLHFKERHKQEYSDLDNMKVSHDRYSCTQVFQDGVLTCPCEYFVRYSKPKAFIRDMVETYYRKTKLTENL